MKSYRVFLISPEPQRGPLNNGRRGADDFLNRIRRAFAEGRYVVRLHARVRMRERGITDEEVFNTIMHGDVIEYYPDAEPYPACLILGFVGERPIHVVCALSPEGVAFLITAYIPSPERWEPGFRRRRRT